MIKVTYTELDGPSGPTLRLEAAGHAGYAPAGQDIVCAGASTLDQIHGLPQIIRVHIRRAVEFRVYLVRLIFQLAPASRVLLGEKDRKLLRVLAALYDT